MDKINKDFDGVSWEWTGKTAIRNLKPICPKCKFELDIKFNEKNIIMIAPIKGLRITDAYVSYLCSKCDFTTPTSIEGIDKPNDLRRAAQREFEHRQRLKSSENTKD